MDGYRDQIVDKARRDRGTRGSGNFRWPGTPLVHYPFAAMSDIRALEEAGRVRLERVEFPSYRRGETRMITYVVATEE